MYARTYIILTIPLFKQLFIDPLTHLTAISNTFYFYFVISYLLIHVFQYSKYIRMANNLSDNESLGKVIYRWSKTQNLNITEQLERGVRYFDLRIAVDSDGEQYYNFCIFIYLLYFI